MARAEEVERHGRLRTIGDLSGKNATVVVREIKFHHLSALAEINLLQI
jgi:hypothetical protein